MRPMSQAALVLTLLMAVVALTFAGCGGATTSDIHTGSATGATIPVVAGSWRGAIESRNASGEDTGWSGTVYIQVNQTNGGDLTGQAKLCDMLVFGDIGPEYYPFTGAANQSQHVRFNLSLYQLEGQYAPTTMRLTGAVSQSSGVSLPAIGVFTPVSAEEYTAACPLRPTPTRPA